MPFDAGAVFYLTLLLKAPASILLTISLAKSTLFRENSLPRRDAGVVERP